MIRSRKIYHIFWLVMLWPGLASAAQLYRYIDNNGTPTLSKTLPAEAAQRGYDIIDDRTMRLIERIPAALTEAELIEQAKRLEAERIAQEQAQREAQSQAEKRRQQRIYDRNLLSLYRSEQELLQARDQELNQWQSRLSILIENQTLLENRLQSLQQQAAQRELSGAPITDNLRKSLSIAEEELATTLHMQSELNTEIERLTHQYALDRHRLIELLEAQTP